MSENTTENVFIPQTDHRQTTDRLQKDNGTSFDVDCMVQLLHHPDHTSDIVSFLATEKGYLGV